MVLVMQRLLSVTFFVLFAGLMPAQDLLQSPGAKSQAKLRLEHSTVRPGETVAAALHLVIPKPRHTYWLNHGGVGEAPSIVWKLPKGVSAGEIRWPLPKKHPSFGSIAYVYEQEVMLIVPLNISADLGLGELELKAHVKWLECTDEECVQGNSLVTAKLTVGQENLLSKDAQFFSRWRARLPDPREKKELQAEWAGPAADNHWRPLAFRVPVKDAQTEVEFFPYLDPKDEFMVQADVEVEHEEGFVKLTQQVESIEGKWPDEVRGVMRIGAKGYEVALNAGSKPEPTPNNPLQLFPDIDPFGGSEGSELTLKLDAVKAKPGKTVMARVHFKIPEGWHVYYKDPGGPGLPPELKWRLPAGITAGKIQWPKYEKYESNGYTFNVYQDEMLLQVPLMLDKELAVGEHEIRLIAEWQECKDICVQYDADKTTTLLVGDETTSTGAKTKVTLLLDADEAKPAKTVMAGIRFKIPDKWHIFWKHPGDKSEAPKIHWRLPVGVTAGDMRWPKHEKYEAFGVKQNVYHDEVVLIVPLKLAADMQSGDLKLEARVTWQECEVSCVQGETIVQTDLKVGDVYKSSADAPIIAKWQAKVPKEDEAYSSVDWGQLGWMLLLAFAGGLILNLMPCVLPVIALKVMGFVNQNQESPGQSRRLGSLYGLGVVFSFLVMAGLLLAVRAGAGGETWGMQMQNKWFLLFLSGLMTLVALNLFGVFEITLGGKTLTAADSMARQQGSAGAFANGMLMVALATPCLAPMLGTAIGFALTQPALVVLLVFVTVAVGLALPYVVLSFKPDWLKFLPKPGAWMESFKIAMGFPMLVAAIWLMTLAGGHFGDKSEGVLRVALMLALIALAAWVFGEFIQRGTRRRVLAGFFTVFFVGAGFGCLFVFQDKLDWKPWSKVAVAKARAEGHPVLVDFTADWCLTCKVNKRTSIEVDSVRDKVEATRAMVFKGDFTDKNPTMAQFIRSYGRPGVPLVLVYSPNKDQEPQILPELLTPGIVLDALDKATVSLEKTINPDKILLPNPDPTQPSENNQTSDSKHVFQDKLDWKPWSKVAVAKARAEGHPVLVDFTADWCLTCKVNKRTSIEVDSVRDKVEATRAMVFKGDFTDKNPTMAQFIRSYGRPGVPLVLVYSPNKDQEPQKLPELLTPGIVLDALSSAVEKPNGVRQNPPGIQLKSEIDWQPWSADRITEAQAAGKPVLVDFTATWCAPCKYIEKTAIDVPEVRKKLASAGVVVLKADFTDKDPIILKEMQRFGRAGPPLVLVYPSGVGSQPIVMPKVFTATDMLQKLDQATGKKAANNEGLEPADVAATGFD